MAKISKMIGRGEKITGVDQQGRSVDLGDGEPAQALGVRSSGPLPQGSKEKTLGIPSRVCEFCSKRFIPLKPNQRSCPTTGCESEELSRIAESLFGRAGYLAELDTEVEQSLNPQGERKC